MVQLDRSQAASGWATHARGDSSPPAVGPSALALPGPVVRALFALLVVALGLVQPLSARAESALEVVERMNREGMEAYTNLDIERAGSMLEEALRVAVEGGVTGRPLALANLNLGVVYIGGLNDMASGTDCFLAALWADRTGGLDPLTSSPELVKAFADADKRAKAGNCGPNTGSVNRTTAPVVSHQPVTHQQSQTPLPIYLEVGGAAQQARLYYKGLGMDAFRRVEMQRYQRGFAYQVSCNDVWEPSVEYYIEVLDGAGEVVGQVAGADAPLTVAVSTGPVDAPPSFPGAAAPVSCAAAECPPGVECAKPGVGPIGEACESDAACQSGLACEDDSCVLVAPPGTVFESASDDEVPWGSSDSGGDAAKGPRFFASASITLGLPFVTSGMPVDRLPRPEAVFVDPQGGRVIDPTGRNDLVLADSVNLPGSVTEWVPDGDSNDSGSMGLGIQGPCAADGVVTGPGTAGGLLPSSYCARVDSAGFAPHAALRFDVGYFLTDRFSLAGIVRLQLASGLTAMSNLLLGARGEVLLGDLVEEGMISSLFFGVTVGQIQAQPSYENGSDASPWIKSGLMGAHAGWKLRYRLARNFGIVFAPELDLQFPDVMFNIDLPLGIEAAF